MTCCFLNWTQWSECLNSLSLVPNSLVPNIVWHQTFFGTKLSTLGYKDRWSLVSELPTQFFVTSSWVHFFTKFNGVFFLGSIMDLTFRKCWKSSKQILKRVSKKACAFGSIIWKVENWVENNVFLPVKRFQLLFPRFFFVWA